MKFDPERFLQDGTLHIPDFYLPFGEGLRSCPGESLVDISLFMFTTHFLYQLNFKLPEKADLDGDFQGFVLNPKPFKVLISPRDAVAVEVMEAPTETIVSFLNGEEVLKS